MFAPKHCNGKDLPVKSVPSKGESDLKCWPRPNLQIMWSSHLIREGGQGEKERSWLNNREIGADNGGELATDKTLEQLWAEKWTWIWTGSRQFCSFVMNRLKFWEWGEVISAARIRLWGKEVDEGTARFYALSSTDFIIPVKDVKVILVKHFLFSYNSLFLLLIFF